ncbi:phosphatase PAP2 family protein [Ectobacillus ponti]|uniref:Phosphatase PAP2 family protein n=1 Tax=Ectobacillus ponti TaxID=2961894 RepID=A0AA42BQK5_9BACI|nr:phosphatase PAP2 family protein [Ectobacillus ponti]MCP8970390.1 phosphatase PAP2 family protein [Ectobacillus ponti]
MSQQQNQKSGLSILWMQCIGCFIIFAGIAYLMYEGATYTLDHAGMQLAYTLRSHAVTVLAIGITHMGAGLFEGIVCTAAALLFVWRKQWSAAALLLVNLAGVWLLNDGLKEWFARVRPDEAFRLVAANSYSFPSGHAMGAASFYGALAFLLARRYAAFRIGIWTGGMVLVLLIGLSRVYLGVHYPSDVIAGFAMGAAWLSLNMLAYQSRHALYTSIRKRDTSA